MQRLVDLLNHRGHHRIEVRRTSDLFGDAPAAAAGHRIVRERNGGPRSSARARGRLRTTSSATPTSVNHHQRDLSIVSERLVAVHDDVDQQQAPSIGISASTKRRASAYRKPLSHDEADVEEPVTQDRVGKRSRVRQGTRARTLSACAWRKCQPLDCASSQRLPPFRQPHRQPPPQSTRGCVACPSAFRPPACAPAAAPLPVRRR